MVFSKAPYSLCIIYLHRANNCILEAAKESEEIGDDSETLITSHGVQIILISFLHLLFSSKLWFSASKFEVWRSCIQLCLPQAVCWSPGDYFKRPRNTKDSMPIHEHLCWQISSSFISFSLRPPIYYSNFCKLKHGGWWIWIWASFSCRCFPVVV